MRTAVEKNGLKYTKVKKIVDYMWEGELVDEIKELLAQPEQEPKLDIYKDIFECKSPSAPRQYW